MLYITGEGTIGKYVIFFFFFVSIKGSNVKWYLNLIPSPHIQSKWNYVCETSSIFQNIKVAVWCLKRQVCWSFESWHETCQHSLIAERMMVVKYMKCCSPSLSTVLHTPHLSSDLSVGETSHWRQQWTVSLLFLKMTIKSSHSLLLVQGWNGASSAWF